MSFVNRLYVCLEGGDARSLEGGSGRVLPRALSTMGVVFGVFWRSQRLSKSTGKGRERRTGSENGCLLVGGLWFAISAHRALLPRGYNEMSQSEHCGTDGGGAWVWGEGPRSLSCPDPSARRSLGR